MARGPLISLVPVAAIREGGKSACRANGLDVLLCNVGGSIFAVENRCSHSASRLDAGKLKGHVISCPLHNARFDVRDGSVLASPATKPLRTFDVVIDAGKIHIVDPGPEALPARPRFGPLG